MVGTLLTAQTHSGIHGPVAEIGVHHGKLILTMMAALRPSERAVAIDLFDDQTANTDKSGKGNLAIFRRHAAKLGFIDRLDIIENNSTLLHPQDITRLSVDNFRMFSVDGGHSYDVVISDMNLASNTLCDGGIILADDYFNYGWPDVSYAVAKFAQHEDNSIFPFAASSSKLYLTNSEHLAKYYQDVLSRSSYPSLEKIQRMGSSDVHVFDTRSVASTTFTFVRILKARLRGLPTWRIAGHASQSTAIRNSDQPQ
ncbi:class I SAM-dependent methyltransferase [Sphingomonas oryzagri]